MSAAPKITALRGGHVTLAAAADAFLATPRTANPNTHRAYASAIDRTIERLGRDRPLAEIADAEIGQALAELWGRCAPATWNRNRAAVTSWLTWCQTKKHWATPSVPAEAERHKESADETRAVAKTTIHRLLSRRDIPLREKTLWRMLYETAARAVEILALNVEDLDLEHRRAPVRSKGGALEWVYWESGTAHLLPRLLRLPDGSTRTQGPLFLSERRPVPAPPPGGRRHLPAHRPRPPRLRPRPRPAGHLRWARPAPAAPQRRHPPRRRRDPAAAHHGQDPAQEPAHRHAPRQTRRRSHRQSHRGPGTPPPYPLINEWRLAGAIREFWSRFSGSRHTR
ncbi:hypothetical protein [Nonomuraea dietziae]|uniref:hypothetical protein n=1 Tax=Nonomuraea dietziae TaxID=65515 RepID=UPI0031D86D17